MKRLIAVGAAFLVVAVAPAGAARPQAARIAKLEHQVKTLTAQVKALQASQRANQRELSANYAGDACHASIMADLFQSTWAVFDQGATTPRFTTGPPLSDKKSCTGIATRQSGKLPPSIAIVAKLIAWLIG